MSDEQINHGSEDANLEHETDRPFIFAVYLFVSWTTLNHDLTSSSITKGSKSETLMFCLSVSVQQLPMGWTVRGSNPGRDKSIFSSPKQSRPALGPSSLL